MALVLFDLLRAHCLWAIFLFSLSTKQLVDSFRRNSPIYRLVLSLFASLPTLIGLNTAEVQPAQTLAQNDIPYFPEVTA